MSELANPVSSEGRGRTPPPEGVGKASPARELLKPVVVVETNGSY